MQLHHVSNQSVRVKEINNQLLPPTHPIPPPYTHSGFQYNGIGTNNSYSAPKYKIVISMVLCDRKDNSEVKMEYTNLLANQLYTN